LLPGIPLIFGGIWLIAAWITTATWGWGGCSHWRGGRTRLLMDLLAGAFGAKRSGASPRAVWGALLGTVVGVFFGLPGLLLGPFLGALLGELAAGNSVLRSAHVGVNAWVGFDLRYDHQSWSYRS